MHIHINHMFCTDSNWGGDYWSRYMVVIDRLRKVDKEDCNNLMIEREVLDEERWKDSEPFFIKKGYTAEELNAVKELHRKRFSTLKPKVLKWLKDNVDDIKDKDKTKGWCVGSDKYQIDNTSVDIWFYRRRDALNFIRTFSVHKKPTTYFDYFKQIRKELDLNKNVLRAVEGYSEEIEKSIYDK